MAKGLPGYKIYYKGQTLPTGEVVTNNRVAYHPLTGDIIRGSRNIDKVRNAGVRYEKRVGDKKPSRPYKMRRLGGQDLSMLTDYINEKKRQGIFLTREEAWRSKEFQYVRRVLRTRKKGVSPNGPNSAWANALVKLGRRAKEWTYNVGESPGGYRDRPVSGGGEIAA